MDITHILDGLNDRQREAVTAEEGHMLVLAGAGSGKTRVLVHRIAWLLEVIGVSPYGILAVTFTNKASAEMRARIGQMIQQDVSPLWVGTFHSLAHRLLRYHHQEAKLPANFQILDSDDHLRLVKRSIQTLNLDPKLWEPKAVSAFIQSKKESALRPQHVQAYDETTKTLTRIYQLYQDTCDRSGLVDFTELLLRSLELLRDNEAVRAQYQRKFRHILVDEFQDTNELQYAWIQVLAGHQGYVTIVGDDDQSIYGWRGAKIENIQNFEVDFPSVLTIRLEQNYRSTQAILHAANAVIGNNSNRLGKNLWTENSQSEPIGIYAAYNEQEEARYIVAEIKQWFEQGNRYDDVAILYRNNALSRVMEEGLLYEDVPYRIYGGMRFFERLEIRDAMGYLRMLSYRGDDAAFERVINTPARGIGPKTVGLIRDTAQANGQTLWEASQWMVDNQKLPNRASNAIQAFIQLIEDLAEETEFLSLSETAEKAIQRSGLLAMYEADKVDKGEVRVDNLKELISAAEAYEPSNNDEGLSPLDAFVAQVALDAGDEQAEAGQDAVQLMTLHSAKGLEFKKVFLIGFEEGIFPSERSVTELSKIEEERRLCYVGMTRAMEQLVISYAENRRLYGKTTLNRPSRFIAEIPDEHKQEIRSRSTVYTAGHTEYSHRVSSHEQFEDTGFRLGQRVLHSVFGEGVILNYEGVGAQSRVQVNFDQGSKWLVVAYAKLTPLD